LEAGAGDFPLGGCGDTGPRVFSSVSLIRLRMSSISPDGRGAWGGVAGLFGVAGEPVRRVGEGTFAVADPVAAEGGLFFGETVFFAFAGVKNPAILSRIPGVFFRGTGGTAGKGVRGVPGGGCTTGTVAGAGGAGVLDLAADFVFGLLLPEKYFFNWSNPGIFMLILPSV